MDRGAGRRDTPVRGAGILGAMSRRLLVWGGVWAVVSAGAFLLDPILGSFVAILGLCAWVVALLGSSWDRQTTFEERELERARRRAERRERTRGARERDRARWEAHRSRKARRSAE
jgi:hypothetical protein